MLIDTHAHLYWDLFEKDIDKVIHRALDGKVSTIINIGVDLKTSQKALSQTQQDFSKFPGFTSYCSIGIHPHEAVLYADNPEQSIQTDMDNLEKIFLSNSKNVVAIGECGLDYLINTHDLHLQQQLFQAQINLAKKLNLPLVVHCRDDRSQNPNNTQCWNQVIQLTKDHFGIYHCYSGLPTTTSLIMQNTNFFVSFAASITYPKNEYLREAAKILTMDRIVLETDCPFLPPQSKRGQRNEPSTVTEIAQLIADLKQISYEEVEKQTTENAKKAFKI